MTEVPVMKFFEDGEWLKIESGGNIRYLKKEIAKRLLAKIGEQTVSEKSEIFVK